MKEHAQLLKTSSVTHNAPRAVSDLSEEVGEVLCVGGFADALPAAPLGRLDHDGEADALRRLHALLG